MTWRETHPPPHDVTWNTPSITWRDVKHTLHHMTWHETLPLHSEIFIIWLITLDQALSHFTVTQATKLIRPLIRGFLVKYIEVKCDCNKITSETEMLTFLCQMSAKQMVISSYPSLIPRPQHTKLEVWNETTIPRPSGHKHCCATLAQAHSQYTVAKSLGPNHASIAIQVHKQWKCCQSNTSLWEDMTNTCIHTTPIISLLGGGKGSHVMHDSQSHSLKGISQALSQQQ